MIPFWFLSSIQYIYHYWDFFLKNDEKPCNGMKLEVIPDQIEDEAE